MHRRLVLPSLLAALAVSCSCAAAVEVAGKNYPAMRAVGEGPDGDDNGESHACTGIQPGLPAVICVRAGAAVGVGVGGACVRVGVVEPEAVAEGVMGGAVMVMSYGRGAAA